MLFLEVRVSEAGFPGSFSSKKGSFKVSLKIVIEMSKYLCVTVAPRSCSRGLLLSRSSISYLAELWGAGH